MTSPGQRRILHHFGLLAASPSLDLGSERAVGGCQEAPGPCVWAGVALEWVQGNWSEGPGGSAGPEGEEFGSGSGFGSGHGGAEWPEGGAMLSAIWETEGLQTVGIVVLVFASIKLLHLLGLISFSEGKTLIGTEEEEGDDDHSCNRDSLAERGVMCCKIANAPVISPQFMPPWRVRVALRGALNSFDTRLDKHD